MSKKANGNFFCEPVKCPQCEETFEPLTIQYSADRITEWKKENDDEWEIKSAEDGKFIDFTAIVCRNCKKIIGVLPFTEPKTNTDPSSE